MLPPIIISICKFNICNTPTLTTIDSLLKAVNYACKLDLIPTPLLHIISTRLTPHYKTIIDISLISVIVPTSMKLSLVTPIIKNLSLEKCTLSNYRPISNLSYISKIIERVVCSQFINYLNSYNILNKYQSAYTLHKSTETLLKHILNKIRLFPTQHSSIIVLFNLSVAFDTIDHIILLHLLESIGLSGVVIFVSHLTSVTEHTQYT